MNKIIFATGNEGKFSEVKKIFEDTYYNVVSLSELGYCKNIIEDADTFEGNAKIKAKTIFDAFGIPVIADDSGLQVEQLEGKPGVFSARYAGKNCTYDDNNNKIILELSKFSDPHFARFVCCAVFFDGTNYSIAHGELKGKIVSTRKGKNGFGYDPIFVPDGYDSTLAELSPEEKNNISHRGKAFTKLKRIMLGME